jgi:energy-coupling factor transporter ATP-binding protein EcfA2
LSTFDVQNQRAVDRLNQRGGRMLSLVDLLDAGTVDLDVAASLAWLASRNASFLTAAGPGGVGKTTLLGAVLAFLPPTTEIVTIEGPDLGAAKRTGSVRCYLAHELSPGFYYSYLWAGDVPRFLSLAGKGGRIASTLHATTMEEAVAQLADLGTSRETLGRIDCFLFMTLASVGRRVTAVWMPGEKREPERIWSWSPSGDRFEGPPLEALSDRFSRRFGIAAGSVTEGLAAYRRLLLEARQEGVSSMEGLRSMARRTVDGV